MALYGNADVVALVQGAYFFLAGIWPIFSIGTFQRVTGPKRDLWLVKTVGVVIAAIGGALLMAGLNGEVVRSIVLLALSSALGLTAIEIVYVAKGTISRIYLLDAVLEVLLVLWWGITLSGK